jgi:hypothetical protein
MQSLVDELSAALSLVKSWFKIADVFAKAMVSNTVSGGIPHDYILIHSDTINRPFPRGFSCSNRLKN